MSDTDKSIRLSKRMAELGLCSRREADEFIERGWVKVDGVVVDVLGSRVRPDQRIDLVKSAETELAERVTILLHKPVGYVCGPAEPGERPAWQLVKQETRFSGDRSDIHYLKKHHNGLAPAGWLDVDASGLLVLTQDGRVSRKLISSAGDYEQEFLVDLAAPLPDDALARLNGRPKLDGEVVSSIKVSRQSDFQLRIVVRENRNRLIRQLCDWAGIKVTSVRRIRVGRIALADLPQGQWRYLRADERF
ncbi:23S rRNA pseudouridine2604 synthase [Formivibrio citricus]|uniref:Dual-specificity RNA pseudouridine synthase RluF n=1 Tax=Formivibrio citricus TaxID=83765 RepID=A0A1I5D771_9NEIS|nr:S4 domain-containing protein [Formivibrio citricus]SFN95049.1 23S rRNA pseudouridine2604 synthase [Formivibrio citricus]